MVKARTGVPLQASGIKCERGRFNRVDVIVEFPGATLKKDYELARSQAFVLIESALGEDILNRWVGGIEATRKGWGGKSVDRLPEEVDRLVREISSSLPTTPLYAAPDEAMWSLFELEPTPADDFAAQYDMFVGKSMNGEMWQNTHSGVSFYSGRYSALGEVFCYLKIDGSEGLTGEVFSDKADIEDALDDRLRSEKLGCFVGGGTGLRYSYVDLSLTNVWDAVPVIRSVLRAGNLTRRSWIQFYDTDWQDEWLGIWEDSPPPPLERHDE